MHIAIYRNKTEGVVGAFPRKVAMHGLLYL